MKNKSILFLPSSRNHINFFYPILRSIQKYHDFIFITQGSFKDEGAENELLHLKIPFKTINEYPKLDPNIILEKENIGLVIVGNDSDIIPQWFIHSAKEKQIPSILIQDGLLMDITSLNDSFFHKILLSINQSSKKLLLLSLKLRLLKQIKKIGYGQAGCTQIHVWSIFDKNFLLKKNVPENSIFVTGNMKFNDLSSNTNFENKIIKPTILYAPTDLIHTKILSKKKVFKIVDDICRTVFSISGVKLIIKPHPIEENKFYNFFIKNYQVELSNQDLVTLIGQSTLIITNLSAATFDALQQKKSVIIYLPEIEKIVNRDSFPFNLIEQNILFYAKNSNELLEKIQHLLENPFHYTRTQLNIISSYLGQRNDSILKITDSINEIMARYQI
jgi:hypothetical protein